MVSDSFSNTPELFSDSRAICPINLGTKSPQLITADGNIENVAALAPPMHWKALAE